MGKYYKYKNLEENRFQEFDKSDILSGPLHIAIDITNKCNAKCLHCFNRSGNELLRNEISDREMLEIFKEIAVIKPFSTCFCGGEPMMKYDLVLRATEVLKNGGVPNIATSKRVDKVLDLCAGSGIQGICAANKANSVTLVEINHKTIPFTKFNIVLNNVEDKVRVKEGSLYENLGNTTFDEIYVNPPFIAVPQDWNFPIAGNGGENGLEITLNIIRGYKRHLNINGRAYMVGEAIGTEKEPFLIDELRTELGNDFKITVILDFKFSIEAHLRRSSYVAINMGKMNGKNADELFEKYKDWIKKVNATSVYNYYLKVERTQPAQGSIEVINMTTTWSKDDVPVLKNNKDFQIQKFPQYYAICRNGKIIAQLDDATLTFIKKIDGKLTIEEIYQKLCEENKNVANYLPRVEAIESLAEACGTLKARNIIEKCNRN